MFTINISFIRRTAAFVAAAFIAAAVQAPASAPLFGPASPWLLRADDAPAVSRPAIVSAARAYADGRIVLNTDVWTPFVSRVTNETPRLNLRQGPWLYPAVPVGADALRAARYFQQAGDTDASICIIDRANGVTYSFWGLRPAGARLTIGTGARFSMSDIGWWDNLVEPWAGRASGASKCGGLIFEEELKAGRIDHALALAWPRSLILASQPVFPARTSDGTGRDRSRAVPMGTRVRLSSSISVAQMRSWGLSPADIVVARALQTHGAYVVDSASNLALYAESGLGSGRERYGLSVSLPRQILERMEFVEPPRAVRLEDRFRAGFPRRMAE